MAIVKASATISFTVVFRHPVLPTRIAASDDSVSEENGKLFTEVFVVKYLGSGKHDSFFVFL